MVRPFERGSDKKGPQVAPSSHLRVRKASITSRWDKAEPWFCVEEVGAAVE